MTTEQHCLSTLSRRNTQHSKIQHKLFGKTRRVVRSFSLFAPQYSGLLHGGHQRLDCLLVAFEAVCLPEGAVPGAPVTPPAVTLLGLSAPPAVRGKSIQRVLFLENRPVVRIIA
ncbi:hypothetical protein E2C01_023470 [Portunus trituberculatus]|uniref:Uncharacterized protein n=1 Tax=Portunus trituberculatus TaxID=210409 RepID=A0A5B7E812_PORTR|nr:hypothetical protein [Portunus trituberculatus]